MNLKRLAEISPLLGGFLIFIGYFKLDMYYDHWGIEISAFLDFSEIILAFLSDTNTILFFLLILTIHAILGYSLIAGIERKIEKHLTVHDEFAGIIAIIDLFFDKFKKPVIAGLAIFTVGFYVLFGYQNQLVYLYFSFIFSIQLVIVILDKVIGIADESAQVQIMVVVMMLGFTWSLAYYDIRNTEKGLRQVELKSESLGLVSSNENFLFVGKTDNFYFFFDRVKNHSVIIQENGVSDLTIAAREQ